MSLVYLQKFKVLSVDLQPLDYEIASSLAQPEPAMFLSPL